jgi:DNA modification methylase
VVAANCPQADSGIVGPHAIVRQGDARRLLVEDKSIDLVLTSPPYLNAIDYMRCSKFSLVWMGYSVGELRRIRGDSVGTEAASEQALESPWVEALISQLRLRPKLSSRNHALLATYVYDMGKAITEVSRVLKRRGRAVYVVGDSTNEGTFIRNSAIVAAIAQEHGLRLTSRHSRALPANRRYLPPPGSSGQSAPMDARLRREVVLVFGKA